jgi:hypothetical protein
LPHCGSISKEAEKGEDGKKGHGLFLGFREGPGIHEVRKGFKDFNLIVAHVFYSMRLSRLSSGFEPLDNCLPMGWGELPIIPRVIFLFFTFD